MSYLYNINSIVDDIGANVSYANIHINEAICFLHSADNSSYTPTKTVRDISDGHYTFGELYEQITVGFITICNLLAADSSSWKARLNDDSTLDKHSFIAGINTPKGIVAFNIDNKYWDCLDVPERKGVPKYDNNNVMYKLLSLTHTPAEMEEIRANKKVYDSITESAESSKPPLWDSESVFTNDSDNSIEFAKTLIKMVAILMRDYKKVASTEGNVVKPEKTLKDICDGHHTFGELYNLREIEFITICNLLPEAWRTIKRHDIDIDPEFNNYFTLGVGTPLGIVSCSIQNKFWDFSKAPVILEPLSYDPYTGGGDIARMLSLTVDHETINELQLGDVRGQQQR